MGAEIDRLEVKIETKATKVNNDLDDLVAKLGRVSSALSNVNNRGLSSLSDGVAKFGQASAQLANVKTTDFNRLAKNIGKLSNLNTKQLYGASHAMRTLANSMNSFKSVSANSAGVIEFAGSIGKLGSANVQRAITNLPQLATELNKFMTVMANAPVVSRNIVNMTAALAKLASQGSKVGSATKSINKSLVSYGNYATSAEKKTKSLASALGKLYANFWWIKRIATEVWKSTESSMDFLETVNYFEVAMRDIGDSAASKWQENGYASAEVYAESFSERAKELTEKMTGYSVDANGNASYLGAKSLGMDPDTVMQYQATFAQVSASIGVAEESALKFSKALTMLGADWASLRNLSFEQGWEKFASALAGQSRAVRSLGIDITNATLQEYAYKYGLEEAVSEMNQATKAQLRLLAILDQSTVAFGDLANTISSPSNQLRMLQQNASNLARTIGNLFLPVLQKALPYINGMVIALQNLFSWIGNLLGIEFDSVNSSMGGMSDEMYDLVDGAEDYSDALDDANDSAKKLKNSLQSWHEINNISTQDDSSAKGGVSAGGGSALLDDAISDALSDYENQWNEAFANMENKAQEFAEKVSRFFGQVYQKAEPLRKALEKMISPLAKIGGGVGKGFLQVFKTLASILSNAMVVSLTRIATGIEAIAKVTSAETWEALGIAIGGFVVALLTFKSFLAISGKITSAITGLNVTLALLEAHPYAAVASAIIGLVTAFISLDNMFIEKTNKRWDTTEIELYGDTIENLKGKSTVFCEEAIAAFNKRQESISTIASEEIPYLESLAAKYMILSEKTALTGSEQTELNLVTQTMLDKLPELQNYYDEATGKLDITREALSKLIEEKKKELMLNALSEHWAENLKAQVEAQKNLKDATEKLSTAQGNLNAEYEKMDSYRNQFSDPSMVNLQDYQENIAAFSEQVDSLSKDVLAYADALETLEGESKTYETMYTEWINATSDLSTDFATLGEETGKAYAEGIDNTANVSVEAARDMATAALDEVNSLYDDMYSAGEYAMQGFSDGLESVTPEITAQVDAVATNVQDTLKKALEIHSPSRVMFELGEYTMEGYQLGLESLYDNLDKSFGRYTANTVEQLKLDLNAPSAYSAAIQNTNALDMGYLTNADYSTDMSETNYLLREILNSSGVGDIVVSIGDTEVFRALRKKNREEAQAGHFHFVTSG